MNESVKKAVEFRLEAVKGDGELIHDLIKNTEKELERLYSKMDLIVEEKHELEKFLHSPRSEKISF